MKTYLAIFLGSADAFNSWKALDAETRKAKEQEGMTAWMTWANDNKASIIDNGSPVGKTKRVSEAGIEDTKNEIGAYVIVQAASHEDAAALFVNHPHFTLFPGHSVEVMECLPMPTM